MSENDLVGLKYSFSSQVRRTDGNWHSAEVIHRRLISEGDGSAATTSASTEGAGPPPAKAKKTAETSVEKAEGSSETGEKSGDGGETSSTTAGTAAGAVDDKYEYYVHYSGFNRRLDEWVRRDRVKLADQDVKEVNLDRFRSIVFQDQK